MQAALFDLDGTLTMSDHLHYIAWREELAACSTHKDLSQEEYNKRISGRANTLIAKDFLAHLDQEQQLEFCINKEKRFRELAIGEHALQPLPGLLALLADMRAAGMRVACVTNAPRINAEFMLRAIGLCWNATVDGSTAATTTTTAATTTTNSTSSSSSERFSFDTLVIGEECSASKPDPAPYLEAIRRLDLLASPHSCLVFEDSKSGIMAGNAAKVGAVIGLCTTHSGEVLLGMGAHHTANDFAEMSVEGLAGIWRECVQQASTAEA